MTWVGKSPYHHLQLGNGLVQMPSFTELSSSKNLSSWSSSLAKWRTSDQCPLVPPYLAQASWWPEWTAVPLWIEGGAYFETSRASGSYPSAREEMPLLIVQHLSVQWLRALVASWQGQTSCRRDTAGWLWVTVVDQRGIFKLCSHFVFLLPDPKWLKPTKFCTNALNSQYWLRVESKWANDTVWVMEWTFNKTGNELEIVLEVNPGLHVF